tara:strand:- start:460 stop:669 length:210 start_codon:yes stop_codon:yes gene_type:complete
MKKVKIKKVKDHEELQAENYLRLEKRVDVLEEKIDKLTDMIECHINFIDKTYEHLKNPIKSVSRFFGGK